MAASLRRVGRKTKARAYDAMIAATALAPDLPVYTCNPDDFTGIDGLDVVSVPVPDSATAPRTDRAPQPFAGDAGDQEGGDLNDLLGTGSYLTSAFATMNISAVTHSPRMPNSRNAKIDRMRAA